MVASPNCSVCDVPESYEHVFITCPTVNDPWKHLIEAMRHIGINSNLRLLRNIVIGYKISQPDYFYINVILATFGFSLYKAYFLSQSRTETVNIYALFKYEFYILHKYLSDTNAKIKWISCLNDYFLQH